MWPEYREIELEAGKGKTNISFIVQGSVDIETQTDYVDFADIT